MHLIVSIFAKQETSRVLERKNNMPHVSQQSDGVVLQQVQLQPLPASEGATQQKPNHTCWQINSTLSFILVKHGSTYCAMFQAQLAPSNSITHKKKKECYLLILYIRESIHGGCSDVSHNTVRPEYVETEILKRGD